MDSRDAVAVDVAATASGVFYHSVLGRANLKRHERRQKKDGGGVYPAASEAAAAGVARFQQEETHKGRLAGRQPHALPFLALERERCGKHLVSLTTGATFPKETGVWVVTNQSENNWFGTQECMSCYGLPSHRGPSSAERLVCESEANSGTGRMAAGLHAASGRLDRVCLLAGTICMEH